MTQNKAAKKNASTSASTSKTVKKTATKAASKTKANTSATKKVAKKETAPKAAAKSTPAVLAIRALIDVGFGNHLYIRGEGAGLSWDHGQPMACLGAKEWQWTTSNAVRPIAFKVLINDHIWSVGDDFIATPGEITVVEPAF